MTPALARFVVAFKIIPTSLFGLPRDLSDDPEPRGDCQDFARTVRKIMRVKPWEAVVWRCWSPQNGLLPRHAVIWVKGHGWIDSTTREWRSSPKPHRRAWPVGAPVLAIIAALFWASPLRAETVHSWGSQHHGSTSSLEPTTAPGAVAQVTFDNRTVHADERVTFDLTLNGMTVTVEALVGRGLTPDRMTVIAPEGFYADPPEIDVPEDEIGVVLILPFLGY